MSLDWDATACADQDAILHDPDGRRVTEAIIISLMDVGMRGLTEQNVEEFLDRTAQIAIARGGTMLLQMREGRAADRPYTRAEVEARVGLTTNVSPMTSAKFTAKLLDALKRYASEPRPE
jgi:hypothetical protein